MCLDYTERVVYIPVNGNRRGRNLKGDSLLESFMFF